MIQESRLTEARCAGLLSEAGVCDRKEGGKEERTHPVPPQTASHNHYSASDGYF